MRPNTTTEPRNKERAPATKPPTHLGRAESGRRGAAAADANLHLRKDRQGNGAQQQQQHKQINATNRVSRGSLSGLRETNDRADGLSQAVGTCGGHNHHAAATESHEA